MKNYHSIFLAFLLTLLVSTPVLADDTEIFIGTNPESGKNNIILSIDTSGSMLAHVVNFDAVTIGATSSLSGHPKYNPATNYPSNQCHPDYAFRLSEFNDAPIMPYVAFYENRPALSTNISYTCRARDVGSFFNERYDLIASSGAEDNPGIPDDTRNATPIADLGCATAKTELETKGYFVDSNNACSGSTFDRMHLSGNFIRFIDSLTNNNGYPLKPGTNNVDEWRNFFIESRLDIVKDVVNDIITNNENYDINLGLMRFTNTTKSGNGTDDGGIVARNPLPLLNATGANGIPVPNNVNQNKLRTSINSFVNFNGTPLEETYYESYLYFTGKDVLYGGDSINDATTGSKYKSPITHACQKNSIILLTDGAPSTDGDAQDEIRAATSTTGCTGSGDCMDELAKFMNEQDLFPDDTGLTGPDGNVITSDMGIKQTVQTSTIGFFNNNALLNATATAGGGISDVATNADELRKFFATALSTIIEESSTFTSPSVSVNNFNRLTNDDELFFTLFEPKREPIWVGNIKQYKLDESVIVDVSGSPAVDPDTGAFKDSAQSFWTPNTVIDGNKVEEGGFASRITTSRNIFSNLDPDESNLANIDNRVTNTNVSKELVSAATDTERDQLIEWIYGRTTNGSGTVVSTNSMGDPLHSTPIVLSYPPDTSGTTPEADQTIFVGTNTGFLHALDPSTSAGSNMEEFSFIPKDLLPRVPFFRNNNVNTVIPKGYALDGPISSWIEDDDGNRIIETPNASGTNEKAHIYVTMRRGGKNVYALDVTDRAAPKFEWEIVGGPGGTAGFEELGQTWSRVTPATIAIGRDTSGALNTKDVLIFAGGYDPDQDEQLDTTTRVADDQGRAIYIVDPDDGELLWRAVPSGTPSVSGVRQLDLADMNYSVPSGISVIDVNTDGIADRMYVGDMGGQLWRFDISPPNTPSSQTTITGGVIADLSTDGSTSANRKFYYAPSVSRVTDDAFGSYLAIAIGSGKRAAPKSTQIADKFYVIRDPYVFSPKLTASGDANYDYRVTGTTSSRLTDFDITNITTLLTTTDQPTLNDIGSYGYSVQLDPNEKVLAQAFTADNKIFFTTYNPDNNTSSADSCDATAGLGGGRLFIVSLLNGVFVGLPPEDPEDPEDPDDPPTVPPVDPPGPIDLATPGIPPAPQVIISDDVTEREDCQSTTTATLLVGNEALIPPICTAPVRTYWNRYDTDPGDL